MKFLKIIYKHHFCRAYFSPCRPLTRSGCRDYWKMSILLYMLPLSLLVPSGFIGVPCKDSSTKYT